MATARLEIPNHERITRSSRTAPVTGSTFSAPKKCVRAATVGLAACAAAGHAASTAAHAMTPIRFLMPAPENTVDRRATSRRAVKVRAGMVGGGWTCALAVVVAAAGWLAATAPGAGAQAAPNPF